MTTYWWSGVRDTCSMAVVRRIYTRCDKSRNLYPKILMSEAKTLQNWHIARFCANVTWPYGHTAKNCSWHLYLKRHPVNITLLGIISVSNFKWFVVLGLESHNLLCAFAVINPQCLTCVSVWIRSKFRSWEGLWTMASTSVGISHKCQWYSC